MQLIQQRDRHGWGRGAASKEGKASESLLWAGGFKCLLCLRAGLWAQAEYAHTCVSIHQTLTGHILCASAFLSSFKILMLINITYINTFVATSFHIYIYLT